MAEPAVERRASTSGDEADEGRLAQFGYKQELKRDWGLAHNFGISFSIIVRPCPLPYITAMKLTTTSLPERHHRHHDPLRLRPQYGRTGRHLGRLDHRLCLHDARRHR